MRIPIKQPVFHGKYPSVFSVAQFASRTPIVWTFGPHVSLDPHPWLSDLTCQRLYSKEFWTSGVSVSRCFVCFNNEFTPPKTDMDTPTTDGLEKVPSFKYGQFLVSMLNFWGVRLVVE